MATVPKYDSKASSSAHPGAILRGVNLCPLPPAFTCEDRQASGNSPLSPRVRVKSTETSSSFRIHPLSLMSLVSRGQDKVSFAKEGHRRSYWPLGGPIPDSSNTGVLAASHVLLGSENPKHSFHCCP